LAPHFRAPAGDAGYPRLGEANGEMGFGGG